MLRMRAANFLALKTAAREAFVAEMVAHLRRYSPRHVLSVPEASLHEAVVRGVERAAGHGFTQRGAARFFLEAMILLGSAFDTDPLFPWVHETLTCTDYRTPMDRAEALHARLTTFLDQVGDERHAYAGEALGQFARTIQGYQRPSDHSVERDAVDTLRRLYPRKAAACGEAPLSRLVAEAIRRCGRDGFHEPRQTLSVAVLMFVFGYRFDADPFLAWAVAPAPGAGMSYEREVVASWLDGAVAWFERDVESL